MSNSQIGRSRLLEGFILAATATAVAAFLVHEIYDLDVWWQVAIGRDILATGSIPRVDRYSVAGLGRVYHDSHWLFQVYLATFHRVGGLVGVQIAGILLWAATLTTTYQACRRWASVGWSAVLVFLVAMSAVERFLPRPEIVTLLMLALFYARLQAGRYRSWRDAGLLAVLQVIWANSHGLFVLGPFLVGCYWLDAMVQWIRHRGRERLAPTRALLAVLAGTLITPSGLAGWRYALLLLREGGVDRPMVFQTLGELSPVFGPRFRSSPAFWFFVAVLALTLLAGFAGAFRRRLTLSRTLIVLILGVVALTGRRNVVLFTLVAGPFIAEAGRGLLTVPAKSIRYLQVGAALLMLTFAAYPLSGAFYVKMELPARFGFGPTPSFFPHRLQVFLDESGFEGRVLQSNTLGGFYLYHGFPNRLPLTDGRWEVYDESELDWILGSSRHAGRWQEVVKRYRVTGALLAHTSPEARVILPEISRSSDWVLAYYDQAASFWVARQAAEGLPAVSLEVPATLPEVRRVDDGLILNAFLAGVGATGLQKLNLERTLTFGWRQDLVLELLGKVEVGLEQFEAAEETFGRLLGRNSKSVPALNELAFLSYRRGDLEAAREYIERAVELQPEDPSLRENLQRVERSLSRGADTTPRDKP